MEPHKFGFTKDQIKPHTFGLPYARDKDAQAQALKASGQGDLDLYDFLSEALAAGMAASGYGIEHAIKAVAYIPKVGLDGVKAHDMQEKGPASTSKKRNPLLPYAKGDSPVTHAYLKSRRYKKIGGNLLQGIGSALSAAPPTAVNIPGTIYHGHALALTSVHVARLEYISNKYAKAKHDDAQLIHDWCALIRTMKGMKIMVRGASLIGSVIPHASIPTSIATSVAKMGIKLTATGACYAAAAQLQMKAFNEQGYEGGGPLLPPKPDGYVSGGPRVPPTSGAARFAAQSASNGRSASTARTPAFRPSLATIPEDRPFPAPIQRTGRDAGPASAVIWELFTKRGATRLLGSYDVAALVHEPAGWMAIADKLLLI